jgi:hypothetical protein
MPLLCVSWRDLKVKAEFLAQKLQQEGNESSDELAELMETTQDARATLLYRSLSVFFGLASCAPGMCWEVSTLHSILSKFCRTSQLITKNPNPINCSFIIATKLFRESILIIEQ